MSIRIKFVTSDFFFLGVCIIDDDRIVANYDMEFGFQVWQVIHYTHIHTTLIDSILD